MSEGTFTHRIDLIVTLRNAVTGNPVMDDQTAFSWNGVPLKSRAADTCWLFANTGREDFILGVNVRGFEKTEIPVEYHILDARLPAVEIHLVPAQNTWNMPPLLTLEGSMAGIEEIQAVSLKETDLSFVSAKKDECRITLYNPHKKILRYSSYAVVDKERQEFEIVTVLKTLPDDMVLLKHDLKRTFKGDNLFTRPIYGMVSEEGKYLLRVPKHAESSWLVRFVVEGKEYFQSVDFDNPVLLAGERNQKTRKRG